MGILVFKSFRWICHYKYRFASAGAAAAERDLLFGVTGLVGASEDGVGVWPSGISGGVDGALAGVAEELLCCLDSCDVQVSEFLPSGGHRLVSPDDCRLLQHLPFRLVDHFFPCAPRASRVRPTSPLPEHGTIPSVLEQLPLPLSQDDESPASRLFLPTNNNVSGEK